MPVRPRLARILVTRDTVPVQPETRYAKSGDVSIAYQVTGEGPFDLVHVPGFVSHVELAWQVPDIADFNGRLASFSRLIRFDKRGTGMSDRVSGAPTLETRMDDVRAVMDAAGSERAALLGVSEGGPMSILFAATYPQRTLALVLYGTFARDLWAPDYPWGTPREDYRREIAEEETAWGTPEHAAQVAQALAPSADQEGRRALATMIRQSASPGAAAALSRMNMEIDVRPVLSAIRVPTLVLHRRRPSVHRRRLALPGGAHTRSEACRGPGADHAISAGDSGQILEEIERFLAGVWESGGWERPSPTAFSPPCSSRTSSAPVKRRPAWEIVPGARRWSATTSWSAASSCASAARRWTRPGTASSPPSTARRGRSAAAAPSPRPCRSWASRCGSACTRASASSWTARWPASPCTPGPGRLPRPARRGARLQHGQGPGRRLGPRLP